MPSYYDTLTIDCCNLYLEASDQGLTRVKFIANSKPNLQDIDAEGVSFAPKQLAETKRQLTEYFQGTRTSFNVPLAPKGTDYQQKVWQALTNIPFAKTCNYKQLAITIGNPNASRAVGMANSKNPIAIIIPCHRVIGADGSLTGYAGGLNNKKLLLDLEQQYQ